ncbi:MAG: hypothetical protein JJ974_09215 [Phycisphaerales bacterium]|nr:hypothetical protein [Phycisphaerales bacterium]
MDTPNQSTIRLLTKLIAMSAACQLIGPAMGCSGKKSHDWFRFGKNSQQQSEVQSNYNQAQEESPEESTAQNFGTVDDEVDTAQSTQPTAVSQSDLAPTDDGDGQVDTEPAPSPDIAEIQEIIQLYRRLHAEMNLAGRSQVIVELLNDDRERVRLLGFELASRDLSSGATLNAEVANNAVTLLDDPLPSIRVGAARLITRLALPDAMTLITNALHNEDDPSVAIALLRGVERWPSAEAQSDVLRWYSAQGEVREIAASAAWSLADLELWDLESHRESLRAVYGSLDSDQLTNADMKLIAATGTIDDINRLIQIAGTDDDQNHTDAAKALVHTPRGVDPLISLAERYPILSGSASEAILRHRLNPNGVRLTASLPWPDESARIDSIKKICAQLSNDQLSEAVLLIRTDQAINDEQTIQLLTPLIAGTQSVSTRSAPGVVLLAELELMNQRPDRALGAISLLPSDGVDPSTSARATKTAALSHIMLLEFEQADLLNPTPEIWIQALEISADPVIQSKIATEISSREILLTSQQQTVIDSILTTTEDSDSQEPEIDQTPSETEQP